MLNSVHLARTDLNLLVLFDVVLRERNVGRAAHALHLSPSAVSHGLSRLRRLFEDPLFLRTPKGVVPTDRALELADPVADILSRVSRVVESVTPFDATKSTRRFTLGMPDATAAVLAPALLAQLRSAAPSIDIGIRQLFPNEALAALEARAVDLVVVALASVPPRFASQLVHVEDFVIAAREGHPFLAKPTLPRYAAAAHVLASMSGEPRGFIDEELARSGLERRIALTVPNFMLVLAVLAQTDLLGALPRSLARTYAARFGLAYVDAPLSRRPDQLRATVLKSALLDDGISWLLEVVTTAARGTHPEPSPRSSQRSARALRNR